MIISKFPRQIMHNFILQIKHSAVLFFIPLTLLLLQSCAYDAPPKKPSAADSLGNITGRDSLEMGVTKHNSIDSAFVGFFQSDIPCRGCDGSQQTLLLHADGQFRLEDRYFDSTHLLKHYSGTWANENNRIILFEKNAIIAKFLIRGNKLKTIERQGIIFTDSVANKHILSRRESIMENEAWKSKKDAGLELYGLGTEPFWNISIGKEIQIVFNQVDADPKVFPYNQPVYADDTLRYTGKNDKDSLHILITPSICSDGMSDFLYEYSVTIYLGTGIYRGCGSLFNKEQKHVFNEVIETPE